MHNIVLILNSEDRPYIQQLKPALNGAKSVKVSTATCNYSAQAEALCKQARSKHVVTTSSELLANLLPTKVKPKLSNYAGSVIERNGISYLFIAPLEQLVTTKTTKFLTARYISKFTKPHLWYKVPQFDWTLLTAENAETVFEAFKSAKLLGMDIETKKDPIRIDCISITALFNDLSTSTIVIDIQSMWAVTWMRKFCCELEAPKVMQNGIYDIAHLTSWGCPVYNYLFDTISMMHCTYSELPKTLDALAVFWIHDAMYWKDLAQTEDRYEYFKYNALDSWNTVVIAMMWLMDAPQYARNNYCMEFPLVFPTHLSAMTGIKRDMDKLKQVREEKSAIVEQMQARLETMVSKGFNPGSPQQVMKLLTVLGNKDLTSSDEKNLKKASLRHPLNAVILNLILDIRGERKLLSTYLTEGKELNGTILYSLVPWGTDTGRLASQESAFWCGLQIQNIPRGKEVKQTLVAYDGFRLAECDLEQAESRDTAYISGDKNLIAAVESPKDFHSTNCSAFFGVPYEKIYDDEKKKQLDKPLRDLGKRVNHGANYNMGPNVLVDTMGEDKIREAQRILKLPRVWSHKQVAEFLLAAFHRTYPVIRNSYYEWVIASVKTSRVLVGATGWTRYCFGDPAKNKSDLNAYVAHCPQSLNAMKLNKAYMRVFYEIALKEPEDFRLCAQIHDSILFQFREGRTDLANKVQELMQVTIDITSCTGDKYRYTVPAALKAGKDGQGAKYWSETE